jgi:hypothetical protein
LGCKYEPNEESCSCHVRKISGSKRILRAKSMCLKYRSRASIEKFWPHVGLARLPADALFPAGRMCVLVLNSSQCTPSPNYHGNRCRNLHDQSLFFAWKTVSVKTSCPLEAAEASCAVAKPYTCKILACFWARTFFPYLLSSIRIVSIVYSRLHCARHGNLDEST